MFALMDDRRALVELVVDGEPRSKDVLLFVATLCFNALPKAARPETLLLDYRWVRPSAAAAAAAGLQVGAALCCCCCCCLEPPHPGCISQTDGSPWWHISDIFFCPAEGG
jgi:hypothetical protein